VCVGGGGEGCLSRVVYLCRAAGVWVKGSGHGGAKGCSCPADVPDAVLPELGTPLMTSMFHFLASPR
jgi:hypothetical protein